MQYTNLLLVAMATADFAFAAPVANFDREHLIQIL